MSRRAEIRMTDEEALALLADGRTLICATNGRSGWPHLMPLWYLLRPSAQTGAPRVWAWTFARSQKVRNLERDPRATIQVEAGEAYDELRGVMLECDVTVHRELELVREVALELYTRYGGVDDAVRETIDRQAPKRVALEFTERSRATWDHRKLAALGG
jgi:hypothetical protein